MAAFAAGSADDVAGPQARFQALRGDCQQLIADLMTVLVVDLLEVIKVDKQQRAGCIVFALGKPPGCIAFETAAVQHPG